jgi:hypothetical protein
MVGPVAISASLHALAVAVLILGGRFSWPAPPIPIEIQTPTHKAAHHSAPRPAAPDTDETPRRVTHGPGAGHKAAAKPAPPAPPDTQDLKPYAPDEANVVVLLRADKFRKSPHRAAVEQLLGALPDYGRFLANSGLSVFDDFESLLIATSDPRDGFATFLVARFKESPKVHALADRPMHSQDPRVFRFPAPGLALLLRKDEAVHLEESPRDGGAEGQAKWVRQLAQFDQASQGPNGPAVLATISDVPGLGVRLTDGLPTPQAIAVAVTADGSPLVHIKAVFANEAEATRMESEWPNILGRYRTLTKVFGLSAALDDLKLTRTSAQLDIGGRIPEDALRMGLALIVGFLPQAEVIVPPQPEALDAGIR